ncbi:MAG: beta-galactosidase [Verrucomicrobiae bacterium]|nr:beta-galactosidase [Verrucomicrobiae bacterium]
MYFGADYYPEHWVFPFDGSEEEPESRWDIDAQLMAQAGMNVVRMGEFSWGLCEPEEGKYDFAWLKRAMEAFSKHGVKIVLGTPTAAPPIWLTLKHPEILPVDEFGRTRGAGTRRAYSLNSDVYWEYSKKIVTKMAEALGDHKDLVAWQIDNGIGRHDTEFSFNEETKSDWHEWLKAKYGDIESLNTMMGLRFWGQTVTDWSQVPTPSYAPAPHNPALLTDWRRFSSDTAVAFIRMQAEILQEATPNTPVTTTFRPFSTQIDSFDLGSAIDFVSLDSEPTNAADAWKSAMNLDIARSLKKDDEAEGFWVMEQKAGHVSWGEANSISRPGVARLFTYQLIARGATGILYFYWRQPRIGPEKFYGGILTHDGRGENRLYDEFMALGEEMEKLAPALAGTQVTANVAILISQENEWSQNQPMRPSRYFQQRDHVSLFYKALHGKNILTDFAHPGEDLSRYRLVVIPSLHALSGEEADSIKEYVRNGGTVVGTFNTGLVNEAHIAPINGIPFELTDLFGLEVMEFDPMPPGTENHLTFKGNFPTTALHPAHTWCDIIEPLECEVLGTYALDFYAGRPAMTMNEYGEGRAIYIGTMSHPAFYTDLVTWLRNIAGLAPLLRVPEQIEVSMRQRSDYRLYFLVNHHDAPVHIQFFKPVHNFMTDEEVSGGCDVPAHGVMIIDEHLTPE